MQDTVRIPAVMTNIKDTDIMMMTMIIMMKKISLIKKNKKNTVLKCETLLSFNHDMILPIYRYTIEM